MSDLKEIVIPFSGFYNSIHNGNIDSALDQLFQNDNGDAYDGLTARAYDKCNFSAVYQEYAKHYIEKFAAEFELPSLTFKIVESPREYNFSTDRIFCTISDADIDKMRADTHHDILTETACEWFTSRSGFISFYSPDITDWPALADWDHNHLACLLMAYVQTKEGECFDQWKEHALMEHAQCNGEFDNWISENTDGIERLHKIADYLNTRAERGAK